MTDSLQNPARRRTSSRDLTPQTHGLPRLGEGVGEAPAPGRSRPLRKRTAKKPSKPSSASPPSTTSAHAGTSSLAGFTDGAGVARLARRSCGVRLGGGRVEDARAARVAGGAAERRASAARGGRRGHHLGVARLGSGARGLAAAALLPGRQLVGQARGVLEHVGRQGVAAALQLVSAVVARVDRPVPAVVVVGVGDGRRCGHRDEHGREREG